MARLATALLVLWLWSGAITPAQQSYEHNADPASADGLIRRESRWARAESAAGIVKNNIIISGYPNSKIIPYLQAADI